jgi:hypothetical protein
MSIKDDRSNCTPTRTLESAVPSVMEYAPLLRLSAGSNFVELKSRDAPALVSAAESVVDVNPLPTNKNYTVLNPLESMFHVFVSYRVASESKLALDLHDRMQVLSAAEDSNVPFLSRAKRPREYKPSLHSKGMNIFLDQRCLSDGDEWRGDSSLRSGFVGGLLRSAVFVPLLSWIPDGTGYKGSLGGLVHTAQPACEIAVEVKCAGCSIHVPPCNRVLNVGNQVSFSGPDLHMLPVDPDKLYFIVAASSSAISISSGRGGAAIEFSSVCCNISMCIAASEDIIDNVLLELLLALELHLAGKHDTGAIVNCGVVIPVFIGDFPTMNLLSPHPSKATNAIAMSILKGSKLDVSADCLGRSVRDIVGFCLQFQGIRVSDYCPTYPAMICSDHALTTISDRIVKRVSKYMELGSVSLFASSRPQSYETSSWLFRRGMGYYGPILAVHDISSLQQFSAIDVSSANMASLIADAAAVSGRSIVNEALRLQAAVQEAKRDPLSKSLSERLLKFVDLNASFLTAISSPAVIEIGLSKPQVKLFMIVCTVHNMLSIFVFPHGDVRYELATASPTWILSFLAVLLPVILLASLFLSAHHCRRFIISLLFSGIVAATSQFFGPDKGYVKCNYYSFDQSVCLTYQKFTFAYCITWFSLLMFSISRRQDLFWYSAFVPLGAHFLIYVLIAWSAAARFLWSDYWGSIEMVLMLFGVSFFPFILRKIALNAADAFIREDVAVFDDIYRQIQLKYAVAIDALDLLTTTRLRSVLDLSLYGGRSLHPRQAHADIDRLYADAESVNSAFQDLCKSWFDDDPLASTTLCENSPSAQSAFNFKAYNPDVNVSACKPRVISGPVKLASRAICKIVRLYRGDASRLTDLMRCVIVFADMNDLLYCMRVFAERGYVRQQPAGHSLLANLSRFHQYFNNRVLGLPSRAQRSHQDASAWHAFEVLRIKNRFEPMRDSDTGRGVGYRDVSIKLRFGHKETPNGSVHFVPVQEWNSSRVRTLVMEIQLRLKDFQAVIEQKTSVHDNYVFYRDILSS